MPRNTKSRNPGLSSRADGSKLPIRALTSNSLALANLSPFMTVTGCTWDTNLSIHPAPLALSVAVLALLVLALLVLQLLLTPSFLQVHVHIHITFHNS